MPEPHPSLTKWHTRHGSLKRHGGGDTAQSEGGSIRDAAFNQEAGFVWCGPVLVRASAGGGQARALLGRVRCGPCGTRQGILPHIRFPRPHSGHSAFISGRFEHWMIWHLALGIWDLDALDATRPYAIANHQPPTVNHQNQHLDDSKPRNHDRINTNRQNVVTETAEGRIHRDGHGQQGGSQGDPRGNPKHYARRQDRHSARGHDPGRFDSDYPGIISVGRGPK